MAFAHSVSRLGNQSFLHQACQLCNYINKKDHIHMSTGKFIIYWCLSACTSSSSRYLSKNYSIHTFPWQRLSISNRTYIEHVSCAHGGLGFNMHDAAIAHLPPLGLAHPGQAFGDSVRLVELCRSTPKLVQWQEHLQLLLWSMINNICSSHVKVKRGSVVEVTLHLNQYK